ncbi:MAG TPA: hypothetical protein VN609_07860 [Propionibacteriaceae bacterium]|nr:hypothetical protein [Propionibacteriaceae bacterium]
MRIGRTDVAALMLLGVEPAGLAGPELHSALNTVGRDHSREVGQRNHHAVRVAVQMRRIAGPIPVLQNANPIVFEHDTVEIWIGRYGIIHGITVL